MPNLVFTQWREAFDDDDSLDVRMVADPEKVDIGEAICAEYEIEVEDPESDDPYKNPFVFIGETVVEDGWVIADETGKKWRVRFEEVA